MKRLLLAGLAGLLLAVVAAPAHADVVWLCHPDIPVADNPCESPLDTTVLSTDGGTTSTETPERAAQAKRPVDCFYVYPTVSNQPTLNATKAKDPEIRAVTKFQASRFSSGCRMFVPMYQQATLAGIAGNSIPATVQKAYADVAEAWKQYLAEDNGGRGVVLIGHSQGSIMLRGLIHNEIDPNPAERDKLVGAITLGGNVTTKAGETTGGDFANVPLCTERGESGCVVAYSTFQDDPTPLSLFGNTNTDTLGTGFGLPHGPGYEVACTDPALLSGDAGPQPLTVPTEPFPPGLIAFGIQQTGKIPSAPTTWISGYGYAGSCQTINGAHVFRFDTVGASPHLGESLPGFGTHLVDFNLGLDRLVSIARQQAQTWIGDHFAVRARRHAVVVTLPARGTVQVRNRTVRRSTPGTVRLAVRGKRRRVLVRYRPSGAGRIDRTVKLQR